MIPAIRLAAIAASSPSGFTFDIRTDDFAHLSSGYGVGGAGTPCTSLGTPSVAQCATFLAVNAEALRCPGAHIGGWTDTDTGMYWLDVTQVFPVLGDAMDVARARREIAIWSFGTMSELRVYPEGVTA